MGDLRVEDVHGVVRSGTVAVLGSFHAEVRHLAFDDAWVGAAPAEREQFEEQFGGRPCLGVIEDLRGKNPGATPWCGGPPGGCE